MNHSWVVIELTQGYVAIVSAEDYDRVRKYSWHVHRSKGTKKKPGQPYARTNMGGKKVYLHRFVVDADDGSHVDHKNFQTLDNRRENLTEVPPKENIVRRQNCPKIEPAPLFDGGCHA